MWPIVKILWMLNWWIGSIGPVSRKAPPGLPACGNDARSSTCAFVRDDARRPHHVDDPGREAEQEEHDETPGRRRQQTVDSPADPGADNNTRDQFRRKAETARESRGSGCSVSTTFAGFASPDAAAVANFRQPLVQTSEPCGKRSLFR